MEFEPATPAAVEAQLLTLPAPAPADQTYQLLAALTSGSSALMPGCELTPLSLGICSHTPSTPGKGLCVFLPFLKVDRQQPVSVRQSYPSFV